MEHGLTCLTSFNWLGGVYCACPADNDTDNDTDTNGTGRCGLFGAVHGKYMKYIEIYD